MELHDFDESNPEHVIWMLEEILRIVKKQKDNFNKN